MTETARLALPLVLAGQSQKHVTVNEAFGRLDALVQCGVRARTVVEPPVGAAEGEVYALPPDVAGDWAGQAGRLAVRRNGGWDYVDPSAGWRAWIEAEGVCAIHDGETWQAGAVAVSPGGGAFAMRIVGHDLDVAAGTTAATPPIIPAGAIVFGVTGRVVTALGGTATSFRVGVGSEAQDRYGSAIGTGAGAWFRGVTGAPVAYFADTALTLTAEGGSFGGGLVRLAVHIAELGLPRA